MEDSEILRALLSRGENLYFSGRYTEAQRILPYCQKLALNIDDVRDYLSSSSILGMCVYRQNRFSDSITIFDRCINAWKRIGDNWEIIAVWTNKCNAVEIIGDLQGAVDEAEKLTDFIERLNRDEYRMPFARLQNNIGLYYAELNQPEKAEAAYLRSIEISRLTEFTKLYNNYTGLINLYRKQNRITKAFEVYKEYIGRLYKSRTYDELAHAVKECVYLMQASNYSDMAKAFKEKWQNIFASVPGDRKLLREYLAGASKFLCIPSRCSLELKTVFLLSYFVIVTDLPLNLEMRFSATDLSTRRVSSSKPCCSF